MKVLAPLLLLSAAAVLAAIALSAPDRDDPAYEPNLVSLDGDFRVPTELSGDVPPGFEVREFEVENMCQACCPPNVLRAILSFEEVHEVAVDMAAGRASAVVPVEFDPAEIEGHLASVEYPARLIP